MCVSPRDPLVGPISMYFGIVSKTVYGLWSSVFCTCVSRRLRTKHVWSTFLLADNDAEEIVVSGII